jgi:hypothetical protein
MKIYIDSDYYAKPDTELLGYVGERSTREIDITGLRLTEADSFSFIIKYEDGVIYEAPIVNSFVHITSSMLRAAGRVKCQIVAKTYFSGTQVCSNTKKSNIFALVIKPAISGDIQPLPDDEQPRGSLLPGISEAVDGVELPSPQASRIITDVIADAIEKDISGKE